MATWRIHKRYGRGVARVALCAEPYRADLSDVSLSGALRLAGPDAVRAAVSGMLVVSLLASALLVTLMRDRHDVSDSQIYVFRDSPSVPLAPEPEPIVTPEPAVPEPPPVKIVEAKPLPPKPAPAPPVKVARKPPPKPKPAPKAKPPERPRIEVAALAPRPLPAAPDPAPRQQRRRAEPRESSRPAPVLTVAGLNLPPSQQAQRPKPTQRARPNPVEPRSRAIRPALAPTSALSKPEPTQQAPTRSRNPQFASVQASKRSRIDLSPAPAIATTPIAADPAPTTRSSRSRPSTAPRARSDRSVPRLEPALGAPPLPGEATSDVPRSVRTERTRAVAKSNARSVSQLALAPAALAPAREPRSSTSLPAARRTARSTASASAAAARSDSNGLRGVPLGDLASCVSDRQEVLLKQRVLAAVRNRKQCASSTGTYRFVETRNLNSFLMWIESAPGHTASDRCAELNHAVACLESHPR